MTPKKRMRRQARWLYEKALASLQASVVAFNSPLDSGRQTQVLLHLQHAFEMFLKAALVEERTKVFDPRTGRSIGFDKCIAHSVNSNSIRLTDSEAGSLRAIANLRGDEQHWFNQISEQLLYLNVRAGVTLFDELARRVFHDSLANHLPHRVLPITADPPTDFDLLLDEEYSQIAKLLAPGRRARDEARARVRTLLAMEGLVDPDAGVSTKDVDRVEKGIRRGEPRSAVFPKLAGLEIATGTAQIGVTVHVTKKQGAPVRFEPDPNADASAIREVDLQRKYRWGANELAKRVGLTPPKSTALRRHLAIDSDARHSHLFVFDSTRIVRYSDEAVSVMKTTLTTVDMNAIWRAHRPGTDLGEPCGQQGCRAGQEQ